MSQMDRGLEYVKEGTVEPRLPVQTPDGTARESAWVSPENCTFAGYSVLRTI